MTRLKGRGTAPGPLRAQVSVPVTGSVRRGHCAAWKSVNWPVRTAAQTG